MVNYQLVVVPFGETYGNKFYPNVSSTDTIKDAVLYFCQALVNHGHKINSVEQKSSYDKNYGLSVTETVINLQYKIFITTNSGMNLSVKTFTLCQEITTNE